MKDAHDQIKYLSSLPKKIYWRSEYFYLQIYIDCQDNFFIGYCSAPSDYLAPEKILCGVIINGNDVNIEDDEKLIGEAIDFKSSVEKLYKYISINIINTKDEYVKKRINRNSKKLIKLIIKNKQ